MKGTEIQKRILLEERLLEDRYHQSKRNWRPRREVQEPDDDVEDCLESEILDAEQIGSVLMGDYLSQMVEGMGSLTLSSNGNRQQKRQRDGTLCSEGSKVNVGGIYVKDERDVK